MKSYKSLRKIKIYYKDFYNYAISNDFDTIYFPSSLLPTLDYGRYHITIIPNPKGEYTLSYDNSHIDIKHKNSIYSRCICRKEFIRTFGEELYNYIDEYLWINVDIKFRRIKDSE